MDKRNLFRTIVSIIIVVVTMNILFIIIGSLWTADAVYKTEREPINVKVIEELYQINDMENF